MSSKVRRFSWLFLILIISGLIALFGPILFSPHLRSGLDINQYYSRLGSDALTLTGFVLTSLAIIAKQIDRSIFDGVRLDEGFQDIWRTFTLTAIVFATLAILVRAIELFSAFEILVNIVVFLFIFGVSLLLACIYALYRVVDLINQDKINELSSKVETPVELSSNDR